MIRVAEWNREEQRDRHMKSNTVEEKRGEDKKKVNNTLKGIQQF